MSDEKLDAVLDTPAVIDKDDGLWAFRLALKIESVGVERDGEPSSDVTSYEGEILHVDDGENKVLVGHVEFKVADLTHEGPFWVLDGERDDFHFADLFDAADGAVDSDRPPLVRGGALSQATLKALGVKLYGAGDEYVDPDQILLFKLLRILPEARGRGLGLAVINRIMEKFGRGCDFAAMMCHPLQLNQKNKESSAFNRRLALDALETDEKKANRSLARYYRKAGFEPVKGTDGLMVKNIGM